MHVLGTMKIPKNMNNKCIIQIKRFYLYVSASHEPGTTYSIPNSDSPEMQNMIHCHVLFMKMILILSLTGNAKFNATKYGYCNINMNFK